MKRQFLLAFCCVAISICSGSKKILIRLSEPKDSVNSASNIKNYFNSNPFRVYSIPHQKFLAQPSNNVPATLAPSQKATLQQNNVYLKKEGGYFQDSYGNKYLAPQTITYKPTFAQKIVSLNNLPLQVSQPFGSPSQTITIKEGFDFPQYSYGNVHTAAPHQFHPALNAYQYGTPQTINLNQYTKGPAPLLFSQPQKSISVPVSGQLKLAPEFDIFGQGIVNAHSPQRLSDVKFIKGFDVFGREVLEQVPASTSDNHHTNSAELNNERYQNKKPSGEYSSNLETLGEADNNKDINSESNSKESTKTTDPKKNTSNYVQSPNSHLPTYLENLKNIDFNEPLFFENPVVPQVQHYLPRIQYHVQRVHDIPFETPQQVQFRSASLKESFLTPTPMIFSEPHQISPTPLPSPSPTVSFLSSSKLPPNNLQLDEAYKPIPYDDEGAEKQEQKSINPDGQHKKIVIQDDIPHQKIEKENFKMEISKEEENDEETFEKGFKDAAKGFPTYNKQVNFDDDEYRKGSYGEPKYPEAYTDQSDDKESSSSHEHEDSGSDDEGEDYVSKLMGNAYKKAKEQHKQNYRNAFDQYSSDVSDDEGDAPVDKEQKSQPYTSFSTSYPKTVKQTHKYTSKPSSKTNEKYTDYSNEPKSQKQVSNSNPEKGKEYSYGFVKSLSYPLPSQKHSRVKSEKIQLPSNNPFQNGKISRKTYGEPQFHYGFSPISRSLAEDASASASNGVPSAKILPDSMKRVYKEDLFISKTRSESANVKR